jgi:hypothetical protein
MKNLSYIIIASMLVFATSIAFGQDSKQELNEAEKKAADERTRAFGGKKTQSTLGMKKQAQQNQGQKSEKDGSKSKDAGPVVSSNEDQDQSKETTGQNTDPDRSNSPAVVQTTTSESGSPAILSKNNGQGRDGTNTRQRGTYKMAGAEIKGNLGLSGKDGSEKNMKAPKVVKQEERPAIVQDRSNPEVPNENTVPDKKVVSEEAATGEQIKAPKEPKKQKSKSRKSKRNRERDSG